MKHILFGFVLLAVLVPARTTDGADKSADGWITLFDGSSLDGWKAGENKDSWKLKNGILICNGERSHFLRSKTCTD